MALIRGHGLLSVVRNNADIRLSSKKWIKKKKIELRFLLRLEKQPGETQRVSRSGRAL